MGRHAALIMTRFLGSAEPLTFGPKAVGLESYSESELTVVMSSFFSRCPLAVSTCKLQCLPTVKPPLQLPGEV